MKDAVFERALTGEILASELIRTQVLAATLALLLGLILTLFTFFPELIPATIRPLPHWIPAVVIGPFIVNEIAVGLVIRARMPTVRTPPTWLRFVNAAVEVTLPTLILFVMSYYMGTAGAFGGWPVLLYFIYIVASTLRLDFALPAFTGTLAAVEYMAAVGVLLPLSLTASDPALSPFHHLTKAVLILAGGIVAGLVAMRLRNKFRRAFEEATARERVINVFGQHVSPAVVDKLLVGAESEGSGDLRDICVLFLDFRDFTACARQRPAVEVVEYLNAQFAYMIEAIDSHGGFINKFLGDGFMAVFGAPLDDPRAAQNAVAAARDILAEIERRGLGSASAWPLRVGIGIHAGTAVVGNVGSPRRKEFTVIGDTVNLAARLEQLTKEYGARLIVSDAVMRRLGGDAAATPLAEVSVKGYDAPIKVWRLA